MDLKHINEIAANLMASRKAHPEREKGGIYHHGQRTAKLSIELREKIFPEDSSHDDVLTVAAWFHDCAKGIEPHENYGTVVANETLRPHLNDRELEDVLRLIALHCARKPNDNDYDRYAKLLQDADLIDHFGIYEIWMNIQYWSHKEGTICDMIEYYTENHLKHTNRHRELLNFEFSKKVFDDRVAFEKEYINRLMDEGVGKIHIRNEGEQL